MERLSLDLSAFFDLLERTKAEVWSEAGEADYEENLAHAIERIGRTIVVMGDQHANGLEEGAGDPLSHQFWLFRWAEQARHYLVLWRDTLFQHQKARVLLREGVIKEEALRELYEASRAMIEAASGELYDFPRQEQARSDGKPNYWKRQLEAWKRQHNPWPVYRGQIQELIEQGHQLRQIQEQVLQAAAEMGRIRELVKQQLDTCEVELYQIESEAKKAIEFIRGHLDNKPNRIAAQLKETGEALNLSNHLLSFATAIDKRQEEVPKKLSVPIAVQGGSIQVREFNLQRSTRQWVDSRILPGLTDIWELLEEVSNSFRLTLINIQNRVIALTNDNQEGRPAAIPEDAAQPLEAFLEKMGEWKESLNSQRQAVDELMKEHFHFARVYTGKDFLPIPLQSSIQQYRIGQDRVFGQVTEVLGRPYHWISRLWRSVEEEESLSMSEKIVRFIEHNTSSEDTDHYTHIFLTKGYIGDSFRVGRRQEVQRMQKLIRQWHDGYRGAVILSGQRLAGKTLFGELIANRFFPSDTVRLQPNTTIDINGRKASPGYDLKAGLDFIVKHTLNKKTLVWIDDLELWNDPETPLFSEVRDLLRTIDQYAGRIFFMVSMSNWMKARLTRIHQIDRVFQAEINLDRLSKEEVREAILIRHGATHEELVDGEGNTLSSQDFERYVSSIYRATGGNIGEALSTWANSIYVVEEGKVACRKHYQYSLPDFLTPESAVLLSSIMLDRRTNQYRLRKLYGPRFKDKYNLVVQRLLSVGLLRRDMDGWLEIEEAAVNEVGQLLADHQYLQFNS